MLFILALPFAQLAKSFQSNIRMIQTTDMKNNRDTLAYETDKASFLTIIASKS